MAFGYMFAPLFTLFHPLFFVSAPAGDDVDGVYREHASHARD